MSDNSNLLPIGPTVDSGGSGGPVLQTNGVPNGDQSLFNLVAGTNVTLVDNGLGSVTINAAGGGGGSFPIADDVTTEWGTTFPSSFTAQVAGQVTPNFALAVDDTHPLMVMNSSNLGYDFFNVDVTPYFLAPVQIFTGSAQVRNNMVVMGFELGGGNPNDFNFTGVGGDDFDGTPQSADGINLYISASDSGTIGGVPGTVNIVAGTAQFGNTEGGHVVLQPGDRSGSGSIGAVFFASVSSFGGNAIFEGGNAPALSQAGSSREYTTALGIKMISENGGAYVPMVGGGGSDLVSATLATASGATASTTANSLGVTFDIPVSGVDATTHKWIYSIDGTNFLYMTADGNGAGGIENGVMILGDTFIPVDFIVRSGNTTIIGDDAASFAYQGGAGGDADGGTSAGHGSDVEWNLGNGGTGSHPGFAGGAGGAYRIFTGDGGNGSASQPSGTGGEILFRTGGPGLDGGGGVGGFGPINLMQDANVRYSIDAFGTHYVTIPTALSPAYQIADTTGNSYLTVITIGASEVMYFGNTTTNPDFGFQGTGVATFGGAVSVTGNTNLNGDVILTKSTSDTSGTDIQLSQGYLILDAGNSSAQYYGRYLGITQASSASDLSGVITGDQIVISVEPQVGHTVNSVIGFSAFVANQGAGTVSSVHGLRTNIQNNSTGTITDAIHFDIFAPANSGTITNITGLHIENLSGAGIGTSYGIVVDAGTAVPLWIKGGYALFGDIGTASGLLQLQGSTSGSVHITTSATPNGWTLTLPDNDGDPNDVLTTDGTGITSWQAGATGNVAGPGTSTDRAIATWDGITGSALFDNPGVGITSTGNLQLTGSSLYKQVISTVLPTSGTNNYNSYTQTFTSPASASTATVRENLYVLNFGLAYTQNAGVFNNLFVDTVDQIASGHSVIGVVGITSRTQHSGAGDTSTVYDYESDFSLNNASATISTHVGYYVAPQQVSAGTVTNNYGMYIEDTSGTGITNSYGLYIAGAGTYAIWSDSGVNRFDGDVQFNTMVALSNTATVAFNDNQTNALAFVEGANSYLSFQTTNGTEAVKFGNATTNPAFSFLGTGLLKIGGGLAIDGSATQNVTSGTYTPTVTNSTNTDSAVTVTQAQYMRVGNTVTVSGRFTADPTTTLIATSFEISLPVASNIGAAEDVAGTAACGSIASMSAEVIGVAANDTAKVQWIATDVTSQTWSFDLTYQVI